MKPICIIPARAGSKRLPGKNKAEFHGRPIIAYPIRAALESELFYGVTVSTDDPDIARIAAAEDCDVDIRPAHLGGDTMEETCVYLHVLRDLQRADKLLPEFFCTIYPTAAFVTPEEITGAYHKMISSEADACMGVTRFDIHPYRALTPDSEGFIGRRFPELNESPSRDFPAAFASNGTLYWFRTAVFMRNPTYFPPKLIGYETFGIDIDTPEDFRRAERHVTDRAVLADQAPSAGRR